ncbi:MAG: twin-arginine translocation signal domain-containing protein [Acidobacteriia bacterium]|nr:twin-arginine translocation signal domain-containing protein [Terriglobia bacterium]
MARQKKLSVDRRDFLKGAAAGAAALAAGPAAVEAQPAEPRRAVPPAMSPEAETGTPSLAGAMTAERTGSDYMVDVIKSLGFEYVCANPGSSFRGIHESLINYGGNKSPEFITCCHEESSIAMAHGYAKIEGKPLLVLAHGTVGVQHAAMAVYNAYCDRVPLFLILGNIVDATKRVPGVEWAHSVQDAAAMIRDFTKWDDLPASLTHFGESAVRAYKIAMTPPTLPVVLVADGELQENPIPADDKTHVPKLTLAAPPQGDSGAVAEVARLLVAAENPVILADRAARTPQGLARLVELAETLQAAVVDQGGRMNFPSRHPLNQSERARAAVMDADVILGLEMADFYGALHLYRDQMERTSTSITQPGAKLIAINSNNLFIKGNYQDFQRFPEVDIDIAADAEETLPSLTEAVKRLLNDDRKRAAQDRGARLAKVHQNAMESARDAAAFAWDASPISTARLSAELWAQIQNEDWSLVGATTFVSKWPQRLWNFDKHYQYIGNAGGYGIGYNAPAATGAALANRKHGRLTVNIQCDGDLMYAPGILWTAAHHKIPLLHIMHNNRAYHQEVMQVQIMADRHSRGVQNCGTGTTITGPDISYAKLAESMGMYGDGPITDPKDLGPAIRRALDVVKRGEPALLDVATQPR